MIRKGRNARGDRHGSRTKPERLARGDRNGSRTKPERLLRGDVHPARLRPERLARGERSGQAKLTVDKVFDIRRRIDDGETNAAIARAYGLHKNTIRRIRLGETWRML